MTVYTDLTLKNGSERSAAVDICGERWYCVTCGLDRTIFEAQIIVAEILYREVYRHVENLMKILKLKIIGFSQLSSAGRRFGFTGKYTLIQRLLSERIPCTVRDVYYCAA